MSHVFNPSGNLNVAWDASDLPGQVSGSNEISGAMVRAKNLRLTEKGKAITRDGCLKINGSAIAFPIWHIEEMDGVRYVFADDTIYKDEVSQESGLQSAQWSAMQYNAFNDQTKQIFALNGTNAKRITADGVSNWGITAPTARPTLIPGSGTGLTGNYNAKYTYVRKVGSAIVAESNPSPAARNAINLDNQSLGVEFTEPTDAQVTHIRLYRTQAGGSVYYLDMEVPAAQSIGYGYVHQWESDLGYISGTGNKFTFTDNIHGTENTQEWEETFEEATNTGDSGGDSQTRWSDLDEYDLDEPGDKYYYKGFAPSRR